MKNIVLTLLFIVVIHEIVLSQEIITLDGYGKTCSEARNDALSNAVNKAYGSLIYSKTEISNDKLITDEINMLTNGNILKYEVIKPCSENNGNCSIQLTVTVSQTELKKFIAGKGKSVAISGELLKQKSDQEIAAKQSELAIVKNLILQLESFIIDPFDYEISIGKVTIKDGKYCNLPAEINIKSNANTFNAYLKLAKELEKISVTKTDQSFRVETLTEKNYPLELNSKVYFLRNKESFEQIKMLYLKIISKMDDYMVVDGCFKELYLKEENKDTNLKEGSLIFPEPGFVAKTIYGSYTTTIEEIGSLDRINIFSRVKAMEYKNGKSQSGDLKLMKYSETNPLELMDLKNNLLITLDYLAKDRKDGRINLLYNITFTNEGFNKSFIQNISVSQKLYQPIIETSINQVKLNPSKLCGSFINTTDSVRFNYKWETYSSRFLFKNGGSSNYNQYFSSQNLPYGTYVLTIKEKELNDIKFQDILISNYNTKGPFNALYSAFIPGWGTRRVTYDEKKGWDRFALVVSPLALSVVSKALSISNYNKYMNATEQTEIDKYFSSASRLNSSSLILAGLGATFYVYDIVWVFGKGCSNMSKKHKIKNKIRTSEFQIQSQPLK